MNTLWVDATQKSEGNRMNWISRRGTVVLKGGLAITLLATLILWPGWRAELQAQTYGSNKCEECYNEFRDNVAGCSNDLSEIYICFTDCGAQLAACLMGCRQ